MAKATKTRVQPAPPLPVAAPIAPAPVRDPDGNLPDPNGPTPGVIDPQANPESNQVDSPVPSSEMPTGPLPPSATTVDTRAADEDDGKGKPQTAQDAIDRVKEGDFATDADREKAMKKWPHLFAETAKD